MQLGNANPVKGSSTLCNTAGISQAVQCPRLSDPQLPKDSAAALLWPCHLSRPGFPPCETLSIIEQTSLKSNYSASGDTKRRPRTACPITSTLGEGWRGVCSAFPSGSAMRRRRVCTRKMAIVLLSAQVGTIVSSICQMMHLDFIYSITGNRKRPGNHRKPPVLDVRCKCSQCCILFCTPLTASRNCPCRSFSAITQQATLPAVLEKVQPRGQATLNCQSDASRNHHPGLLPCSRV